MIFQPLQYDWPEVKSKAYIDLTGRFPNKYSRGNTYIFLLYDYNTSAIIIKPLKSRQSKEITLAFYKCYNKLSKKLLQPKLFILDNECYSNLKLSIIKNNSKYKLVPSHQHCRDAVKKSDLYLQ